MTHSYTIFTLRHDMTHSYTIFTFAHELQLKPVVHEGEG